MVRREFLSQRRRILAWIFLPMVLTFLIAWRLEGAHPFIWSSKEWRVRIVDKSNGQPMQGAVLVATWHAAKSHSTYSKFVQIVEASSDASGWIDIPAWGPVFLWKGGLYSSEPGVRIMKDGYVPLVLHGNPSMDSRWASASVGRSLNEKTIELRLRSDVSREEYWSEVSDVFNIGFTLRFITSTECLWLRTPKMRRFVEEANLEYQALPSGRKNLPLPDMKSMPLCDLLPGG